MLLACSQGMVTYVRKILIGELSLTYISKTILIALILKVKTLSNVSTFRLISLCNGIYKMASKALDNGLKMINPNIIYENQNAYLCKILSL